MSTKRLVVLYRKIDENTPIEIGEAHAAGFVVTSTRMDVRPGDLVVPRYCVAPFADEFYYDMHRARAKVLNSFSNHCYLADIERWYPNIRPHTPETWFDLSRVPEGGPYVLKGHTSSMRQRWATHMYAENKAAVGRVAANIMWDGLVGQQRICARRFARMRQIAPPSLTGMPVCEEYRFFFLRYNSETRMLTSGFYWSNYLDDCRYVPDPNVIPANWLSEVASKVEASFFALDVGILEDGSPIVVELNDGQMAGLSECNARELYQNLHSALSR